MTGSAGVQPDGFGALGVVRVQIAPGHYVAALPQPMTQARKVADDLSTVIARLGDTAAMVAFHNGTAVLCWIRAREVLTVDVVSTEDPSA